MACVNPSYKDGVFDVLGRPSPIPCGRCMQCRISLQKKLLDRMFCAYHYYNGISAYVTFTYDDNHLVFKTGYVNPTLSKEDLHKYLDKIKHQLRDVDYQYYVCGEYGDKFGRPHYHALFFGLDYQIYYKFFQNSWKKGSVKILPCAPDAFRYVTKYITESYSHDDSKYFDYGQIPPFHKYSRGLGSQIFNLYKNDIEKKGYFIYKSRKIFVNRYYYYKNARISNETLMYKENQLYEYDFQNEIEASKAGYNPEFFKLIQIENKENSLLSKKLREKSNLM